MKSQIVLPAGVAAAMILSACGGGGSDNSSPPPSVTTEIDSTNAIEIAQAVAITVTQFQSFASLRLDGDSAAPVVSERGLLPYYLELTRSMRDSAATAPSIASGVTVSDSGSCSGGGTYSFTWDEVDTPPTYSETGSEVYDNCTEGSLTIDGSDQYSYFENSNTGEFSQSASGSIDLSISDSTETLTIGFNDFDFVETGNLFSNTYTISAFTFTLSFSTSAASFGVAIQLDASIVESTGDFCPESGTIRITGANGSFATATFNGTNIEVSANGSFVGTAPCT